jgi:hypothetical protein
MRAVLTTVLLSAALAFVAGCGGAAEEMPDTGPFNTAIKAYLKSKSMDLAVKEFKTLEVDDAAGSATAKVSLKASADGVGGPAVKWTFTFAKEGDDWKVTGHTQ